MKAAAEALPQTNTRPGVVALLAIAAVAIKGLILFVGIPAYESFFHTEYQADLFPDQYDLLAQNLIDGHGYRFLPETASTTIRTPGFVLVLAGLFFLFGKSLAESRPFIWCFRRRLLISPIDSEQGLRAAARPAPPPRSFISFTRAPFSRTPAAA